MTAEVSLRAVMWLAMHVSGIAGKCVAKNAAAIKQRCTVMRLPLPDVLLVGGNPIARDGLLRFTKAYRSITNQLM